MTSKQELIGLNQQGIREAKAEIEQMRTTTFLLNAVMEEGETKVVNVPEVKIEEFETAIMERIKKIKYHEIIIAELKLGDLIR
jgi:hypothetical protein